MARSLKLTKEQKYLKANYQDISLTKMCEHLNISTKVGFSALKKMGIKRTPELIAKFKGHKKQSEERDNYFKSNYLSKPLTHICKDLKISAKTGDLIMKRLGLVRPPDLVLKFKTTHRGINDAPPAPKKYYVPKGRPVKKKLVKDKPVKTEAKFEIKKVDYSQKILVKIDHKTWVYRDRK